MTVGVASGEYLDPRFDSVPLEWDEQDDFDALRSVEADVALTLQVSHHLPRCLALITAPASSVAL